MYLKFIEVLILSVAVSSIKSQSQYSSQPSCQNYHVDPTTLSYTPPDLLPYSGASKGIGRAIALDLATRGCSILGTYSSPQSAHNFDVLSHTISDLYRLPNEVHSQSPNPRAKPVALTLSLQSNTHAPNANAPKLKGVAADITSLASVGPVLSLIEHTFANKIDILILNAAHNTRPQLGQASASDIEKSLVGNLQWPIVLVENLVRHAVFNANSRIVTLSSDYVRDPSVGSALFSATKTGLEALVRSWALELPLTFPGTTVNAVSVGITNTPGLQAFSAVEKERVRKVKVVEGGRMGCAEDVADVVGFLVSDKARWVTGSVVGANGGGEWVGGSS